MKHDEGERDFVTQVFSWRLVLVSYTSHLFDKSTNLANNDADARGHLFKRKILIESFCIRKDEAVHSSLDERNAGY